MAGTPAFKKAAALAAAAAALAALVYLLWLPDVSEFKRKNPTDTAYMRLREQQAKKSGKKYSKRMEWARLENISPNFINAVVIAEDDTFYFHKGIDWQQMRIACAVNLKKMRFAYGGSTLTQQTARNLYLSPSKNPLRKLKEMIIAKMLEKKLGKRRILEIYLNIAEWGKGVYGAQAAAEVYFGKPASAITAEEGCALASILPSPRRWSPVSPGKHNQRRIRSLLERMRKSGYLKDDAEPAPMPDINSQYDIQVSSSGAR